ncbi:MAG: sugar transferase, partial [bacterium]
LRSMIRPGVTGWAQVRYGYANNLPEETEKMRYDMYYIKHLSFGFDLRILFDTVKVVLFGRGMKASGTYRAEIRNPAGNDTGHSRQRELDLRIGEADAILSTGARGQYSK